LLGAFYCLGIRLFVRRMSSESGKSVRCTLLGVSCILLSHFIVGTIYLVKYNDLETACELLWPYCVVAVVFTGLTGCGGLWESIKASVGVKEAKKKKGKTSLTTLIAFALLIWGIIIKARITTDCINMYENKASQLYTLFQVSFWFIVGIFGLALIIVCCLIRFCGFKDLPKAPATDATATPAAPAAPAAVV